MRLQVGQSAEEVDAANRDAAVLQARLEHSEEDAKRFRARLDCDERRRRSPSPTESLVELMRRVNSNDSMDFRLCVARGPAALETE